VLNRRPGELKNFEFKLNYRGCWLRLFINHQFVTVFFERGIRKKIKLGFRNKIFGLILGETKKFKLN